MLSNSVTAHFVFLSSFDVHSWALRVHLDSIIYSSNGIDSCLKVRLKQDRDGRYQTAWRFIDDTVHISWKFCKTLQSTDCNSGIINTQTFNTQTIIGTIMGQCAPKHDDYTFDSCFKTYYWLIWSNCLAYFCCTICIEYFYWTIQNGLRNNSFCPNAIAGSAEPHLNPTSPITQIPKGNQDGTVTQECLQFFENEIRTNRSRSVLENKLLSEARAENFEWAFAIRVQSRSKSYSTIFHCEAWVSSS